MKTQTTLIGILILSFIFPLKLAAQYSTSYEIDFPGIPEDKFKTMEIPNVITISSVYYTMTKEDKEKVIKDREKATKKIELDETIYSIPEGFTFPADKVYKPDTLEEIAEYYAVYETQYSEGMIVFSDPETEIEEYYLMMKEYITETANGRLISYEPITINSNNGREIIIRGIDSRVYIFNIYLLNNSFYLIEVKLNFMVHDKNEKVKAFFKSFKLKEYS